MKNIEKRIKRLQRQLSIKQKGRRTMKKQRIKFQRKYRKLRNMREDFIDKVFTAIARQYDTIFPYLQTKTKMEGRKIPKEHY